MKKALIVSSVYGFLEKFETQDVRILQEYGYEVHFAANKGNAVYESEHTVDRLGVSFHDVGFSQSPFRIVTNSIALLKLKKLIRQEGYELIHCHTPIAAYLTRLACKGTGAYVIYTAHGFHFYNGASKFHNIIYSSVENYLSRFTDAIVTINKEDYEAACKMKADNVYQIPGVGIDSDRFHLTSQKGSLEARKKLGFQKEDFVLLSIGELRKNKNQQIVLEALNQMKQSGVLDKCQIRYVLLGNGRDTDKMKKFVFKNNLNKYVFFEGYKEDVRDYIEACDVLIFPSIREGLGMAALEALSMGIPVIASYNRGSKEYLHDGQNGIFVRDNTSSSYEEAIINIFVNRGIWSADETRTKIRNSVSGFVLEETREKMREVYLNAGDKCDSICV